MATAAPRQRVKATTAEIPGPSLATSVLPSNEALATVAHPSGKEKHGKLTQFLRGFSFAVYFTTSCLACVSSLSHLGGRR